MKHRVIILKHQYRAKAIPFFAFLFMLTTVTYSGDTLLGTIPDSVQARALNEENEANRVSTFKLDDIQVYGTTELEKIKSTAMTVSVIDAKQYAGRFTSVDELLKRAVGVNVRRSGGVGSVSRISVRGVGGKGLKLFIDGAPISAAEGMFALDNLPIQLIERIEIYKGVAPVHLGADALGGAINVVIIDRPIDYFEASYSVGSYGSHNAVLRYRKHWEESGIRLGLGVVPAYARNNYDMDISFVGSSFEGLTVTRDHDRWYWMGWGVGLAFTKLWFDEIEVVIEGVVQKKENQGIRQPTVSSQTRSILPIFAYSLSKEDFVLEGLDMNYHAGILPMSITNHVDTTHVRRQWPGSGQPDVKSTKLIGEIDPLLPHNSSDTLRGTQQRLNLSYKPIQNHTFNLNDVFQYLERGTSDSIGDAGLPLIDGVQYKSSSYPAKMLSNSLGLAWEFTLFQDRFLNQLCGKMHYLRSEVYGTGMYQVDMLTGIPKLGSNEDYYFGFSEAVRVKVTPSVNVKASYEQAVRLPDQAELFGNGSQIGPGIELSPERSHNVNIGLTFLKKDFLAMPRFEAEVNGFFYDTQDKIKLEPGFLMMVYKNVQHTRTLGVELDLKADVSRWMYLTANATYQDIRDVGGYKGEMTKGERIPNEPWFFMNFGAEFTKHDLFHKGNKGKLFWEGGYSHEFYYSWKVSSYAQDLVESAFIMNAGMEYNFSDKLSFSAEVNDLTDSWKIDEYRMPLPGRTFRANMHLFLQSDT